MPVGVGFDDGQQFRSLGAHGSAEIENYSRRRGSRFRPGRGGLASGDPSPSLSCDLPRLLQQSERHHCLFRAAGFRHAARFLVRAARSSRRRRSPHRSRPRSTTRNSRAHSLTDPHRRPEDAARHRPPGVHIAAAGRGIERRTGASVGEFLECLPWSSGEAPRIPVSRLPGKAGPCSSTQARARRADLLGQRGIACAKHTPLPARSRSASRALIANAPWQHCVQPTRHASHEPARRAASAREASMIWTSSESRAGRAMLPAYEPAPIAALSGCIFHLL